MSDLGGVATAVIKEQMGAKHIIDVFGVNASGLEVGKPDLVTTLVPLRWFHARLVTTDTGVNQNTVVSSP